MQFPGDHQPIPAVVAWPHQHQRPMAPQPLAVLLQQQPTHRQGGLLHQGFHRQAAGEKLLLQSCHLGAVHQQVAAIALRPRGYGGRLSQPHSGIWVS